MLVDQALLDQEGTIFVLYLYYMANLLDLMTSGIFGLFFRVEPLQTVALAPEVLTRWPPIRLSLLLGGVFRINGGVLDETIPLTAVTNGLL